MKYILLINQGTTPLPGTEAWDQLPEAERQAVYAAYGALNENPNVTPGEQMQSPDSATTVRVKDGETLVTDGPFAETKDALGGYFLLTADDLDAAIAIAAGVPAARMGGAVEVRPIAEW